MNLSQKQQILPNRDKEQNVKSKLKLILIDDTVLTTESEREVTVK